MMRPVLRKFDEIVEVPPEAAKPSAEQLDEEALRAELAESETQTVAGYRENLNMAKKLATEDPRVIANVVKAWVGANE
jgi:flagellar M-ring protein FliF